MLPLPGTRLGSWLLQEPTGGGAFGTVFRAVQVHEPSLTAAVKIARYPRDPRFEREAALLARLDHPHVPRLLDSGSWLAPNGQSFSFLVMAWAEGVPLYDWEHASQRPLTSRLALQLLAQVARALEATHAAGAVHRDIKGHNVHVSPDGHAMLLDFGASWLQGAQPLTFGELPPSTEPYRSPQLMRLRRRFAWGLGAQYTARPEDDLYALGVTAYRLLTGAYPPPRTDPDYTRLPRPHSHLPPLLPPSSRAGVAPEFDGLVMRCLSEAPEARPTASQLAAALEQAALTAGPHTDMPVVRRPAARRPEPAASSSQPELSSSSTPWHGTAWARLAGAALVLLALGVLLGRLLLRHEPGAVREQSVGIRPHVGTSGLGEETLLLKRRESFAGRDPRQVLSREMPHEPLEGQQRPPCKPRTERAIHGGCWILIGEMKAPCGPDAFEHEERCYYPVAMLPKKPTSEGGDAK